VGINISLNFTRQSECANAAQPSRKIDHLRDGQSQFKELGRLLTIGLRAAQHWITRLENDSVKSLIRNHYRIALEVQRRVPLRVASIGSILDAFSYGRVAPLLYTALVAVIFSIGWVLGDFVHRDLVAERIAFEARALELAQYALVPGSPLACLQSIAGDLVENACEKALFARPEATAAAVSYVAAQLSLLSWAEENSRHASITTTAQLRRALEADRFGIVAHVLAVRYGCALDRCSALALLRDSSRVKTNLTERPFSEFVKRYAAGWLGVGNSVSSSATETAEAPGPISKFSNNLYFPSSASIPPISIMTPEPATSPRDVTTGANEATAQPRRAAPTAPQSRPQARPNTAARGGSGLTQLAPVR
jgi:hypothetical protein